MECKYCKTIVKTLSALNQHQNKTKYCLKIQGKKSEEYICECDKVFTRKHHYESHKDCCPIINSDQIKNFKLKIASLEEEVNKCKEKNIIQEERLKDIIKRELDLQNRYDKLAQTLAKKPTSVHNNTMNNIINKEIEEKIRKEVAIEIDCEEVEESNEEYQLKPLDLGSGYQIENRESDGYINVTNLCKAGSKKFGNWRQLNRTFDFLKELSSTVGIPTVELVTYSQGGNGERHTWVHPQVAINIAQWISPKFDVKVSALGI
jgi:hypothetical protein